MTAIPTGQEMVARAHALGPKLRERAPEGEKLRRIPDATIADLHEAGLFKMMQPARFGGYELHPRYMSEVQIALGQYCTSTAWVFGVLSVHSWQLGLFELQAQEDCWGEDNTVLISSSYAPVGKVTPTEGGYQLSGRWFFSSGSDHCDWVFLGSFVPADEAKGKGPDMRTFMVPRSDYKVVENWNVSGLRATGSNDVIVEDAFVPEHRTHRFNHGFKCDNPGNEVNPSPIFRFPFGQIHVRSVSTPIIGAAKGALDAYLEVARKKIGTADGKKVKEDPTSQLVAADAATTIDYVELVLKRNFDEMFDYIERGEEIPLDRRVRFRYDAAKAVGMCLEAIDGLFTSSGGRALFQGNPIQRFFQDAHAIRAHHANIPEKPGRNLGRFLLGMGNQDFFI